MSARDMLIAFLIRAEYTRIRVGKSDEMGAREFYCHDAANGERFVVFTETGTHLRWTEARFDKRGGLLEMKSEWLEAVKEIRIGGER